MRLHHLAFRTADVDRLVRFYASVLGLRETRDARPRSVWLELEGAVLMIEARTEDEPAPSPLSRELVAFMVDEALKSEVRERAMAWGCHDGETAHTVYLRDPDGRRVGVSTYPLSEADPG
ncbi:MAG: VOC family protein [Polyangiaceae bacterium]|nr:VOC family protein [Polyangiaceae bacterium]